MKRLIFFRIRGILAGFLLGILVGASGLNIAIGNNLDRAELEIRRLELQLEDQSEQLVDIEKKLALKGTMVVSDIDVRVEFPDEYEKLELEDQVKKILKNLRGKEVKNLDPLLISNMVDNRIINTDEHKYNMNVTAVLVSEKVILYLVAKEIEENLP